MKKLLTISMMCFMAAGVFAQAVKHKTINDDMRIFSKDREEVLTNFNSDTLGRDVRISVILPKDYNESKESFPVVYMFVDNNLNLEQIEKAYYNSKNTLRKAVFITMQVRGDIPSKKMTDFLGRDIFPYFETNYKLLSVPSERVIVAHGANALKVIDVLPTLSGYSNKIALILPDTTPMAALKKGIPDNVRIWAAGNVSNMARLQALLEEKGLIAFKNFAYKIVDIQDDAPYYSYANLKFLLEDVDNKVSKVKIIKSKKSLSALTDEDSMTMWFDVTTKSYNSDYIPQTLKIAPPFLAWDHSKATLTVIYGASKQKVTITATGIPDYKEVETTVKVTE